MNVISNWVKIFINPINNLTIDQFKSWFTYDPSHPLLFNSALFLGLFLIFYCIYVLAKDQRHDLFRKLYVIVFSLFFYYKAGGDYYVLLVICAVMTHWVGKRLHKSENPNKRKVLLILIVVANLAMLSYYKYTNFLIDNFNAIFNGNLSFKNIVLPIGISFFVFEAISYAVDLYRKEMQPAKSTLDFCFYIAFFPKLVAGPIIRAKDFLPQMERKLHLTAAEANSAIFLIMIGLIKKAVISDYISVNFVDRVFDSPLTYTSFENLLAVYGYALQIYCDFSGYSDIAIGLALLMGFTIPPNFLTPYKSQSITEFWRRWHISLSSWLRDYLYISMGGNRKSNIRTYFNLFMTMLIGGLWHGASWKFVVWGGLHGLVLAIERFINKQLGWSISSTNILPRIIRVLITFHIIAFCWIFFRAKDFDLASQLIRHIGGLDFNFSHWGIIIMAYRNVFIIMMLGFMMHLLPQNFVDKVHNLFGRTPLGVKAVFVGLTFWLVFATATSGSQPFIYFQF